jgi:hypothetical protein
VRGYYDDSADAQSSQKLWQLACMMLSVHMRAAATTQVCCHS